MVLRCCQKVSDAGLSMLRNSPARDESSLTAAEAQGYRAYRGLSVRCSRTDPGRRPITYFMDNMHTAIYNIKHRCFIYCFYMYIHSRRSNRQRVSSISRPSLSLVPLHRPLQFHRRHPRAPKTPSQLQCQMVALWRSSLRYLLSSPESLDTAQRRISINAYGYSCLLRPGPESIGKQLLELVVPQPVL